MLFTNIKFTDFLLNTKSINHIFLLFRNSIFRNTGLPPKQNHDIGYFLSLAHNPAAMVKE
jgi:hypothetical protein